MKNTEKTAASGKRALFRADDFGFCEGVNYGILKAVQGGLIRNVGCMTNMPAIEHAAEIIRDFKDICLGLHANISNGAPLCSPEKIPSLVSGQEFRTSKEYRQYPGDPIAVEEAVQELEKQVDAFRHLFGREPGYIDLHGIEKPNFAAAVRIVAERNGILFADIPLGGEMNLHGQIIRDASNMMTQKYDALQNIRNVCLSEECDKIDLLVFHPGYIDQYLLNHSSLTDFRCREAEVLTCPAAREMIAENHVSLIGFCDI